MNERVRELYDALVGVLNLLDAAGEVITLEEDEIDGISAYVRYSDDGFLVEEKRRV